MASVFACGPAPVAPSWRPVGVRAASAWPAEFDTAGVVKVLPVQSRLTSADDFRGCVRGGVRVGRPTLVLHARTTSSPPSRAGFVVSKAVGNAVTRNRVKRRLRHLVAEVLPASPSVDVVVRALPAAASGELRGDLTSAMEAALGKLGV